MSPKTKKQLTEIREKSRKKILDAAFELFATRGYHNTSVTQIAKLAGVAKGLIYNYFEKKEDMVHALIHDLLSEGDDFLIELLKLEDPKDQLKYMLDFSFTYMQERSHDSKLMTSLAMQLDQFPELQELIKAKYAGMMPLLSSLLEKIGVPDYEEEARILGATLDGIGIQYLILQDAFQIESVKEYLIKKYCT